MRRLLICGFLLFLMLGCLQGGKKPFGITTRQDCNVPTMRDVEKIPCYHYAAVSSAYSEDVAEARSLCDAIVTEVGALPQYKNTDVAKKAETERNLCLHDIAKIIVRQPGMETVANATCKDIAQADYKTKLQGAKVTQEICIQDINRIAKIRPQAYYQNPNNICSIALVLPLMLVAAFRI